MFSIAQHDMQEAVQRHTIVEDFSVVGIVVDKLYILRLYTM